MSLAIQALITVHCQSCPLPWVDVADIAKGTGLPEAVLVTHCHVMAELGSLEIREADGVVFVRTPRREAAAA